MDNAFGLLVAAVSFLLVFRLNRAAIRHYEARQLCGQMIMYCRDVAVAAIANLDEQPALRDGLCEVAVGYPVAFMAHLQGQPAFSPAAFRAQLEGVFDDDTMDRLISAKHRPLAVLPSPCSPSQMN